EVGLSFATEHTPQSAWQEIERLIAAHDKPGVDCIVVSAGAPNQHGQVFPSDEALARFALENPLPLPTPNHVKSVTLHSWGEGEAWDLLPRVEGLFGPLYQGSAIAHLLLVPSKRRAAPPGDAFRSRRRPLGVRQARRRLVQGALVQRVSAGCGR